ncbi:hypothetical protein [Nonomuraea jiangxiensis]|uniref:Lipoprotein n=1 Tax=Nonomuraea jiangxiensis TaxID=633440 RepID=A0A1G9I785_9ACTN|nr:hypothetical protein [Nonomuraea jiangxiensis]SDL20905.1 hypothetical protein SAMN05421869_12398 [Nonomuraea jiangxiensis]
MTKFLRLGAVALLAASTACGSEGAASGSGATSDAEILGIGKELAQCIRQNGAPNFPDPTVKDGRLVMAQNQPEDQVDKALAACDSITRKLPQSAVDDRYSDAEIAQLRKFAQCIRENGVPEWPDPKSDGSFPVVGTPLDGKTERLMRARQACVQHWAKGWRAS